MTSQKKSLVIKLDNEVDPFYKKGTPGTLLTHDRVELAYRSFEQESEKAALVILPGRSEPIEKYAEVIYDLRELGLSIYVFEHRGQGESGLVEDVQAQYVRSYDDYVKDLDLFIRTKVRTRPNRKLFLLGHSMGGAIASLYAAKYPDVFQALVLSAPMLDINTKPYPKIVAYWLSKILCKLGLGKLMAGRDSSPVTSDKTRDERNVKLTDRVSKIRWRLVTYQWIYASLEVLNELQIASLQLKLPVLLLQAEKDLQSPALGQNQFFEKLSHGQKLVLPGSLHEVLMEKDSIRDVCIQKIQSFITSYL
jgi:lysophospholipase